MDKRELELARSEVGVHARLLRLIVGCSLALNILALTGSFYMMLVYDSVLPSGSGATLAGLFVLMSLLYALQWTFEGVRSDASLAIANAVQRSLFARVHRASCLHMLRSGRSGEALQLNRDLDQVYGFLAGNGPIAIIDLPWVIVFVIALALVHWALCVTALVGVAIILLLAWMTAARTAAGTHKVLDLTGRRLAAIQANFRFVECARAMGIEAGMVARAEQIDTSYVAAQSFLSSTSAHYGGTGRLFRMFLQSAMLTVGALLVIDGQASGGVILGASILSGRALAPVDQAVANWRGMFAAREGWARIARLLEASGPTAIKTNLDDPRTALTIDNLHVAPPGTDRLVLSGVSLTLAAGEALAVIGPSAAGKTTLAKTILGLIAPRAGEVRLDGATLKQWDPARLGARLGYVPQVVELMEGTLGENIARFDPRADSSAIIAAASLAGFHKTILSLPKGYDTPVSSGGIEFSAGQRQRIGLARALYGDPFLLVLDEPNSNLDIEGEAALTQVIHAVRARGGLVVIVTHRTASLAAVSHVALMHAGRIADFGPRDEVLARMSSQRPAAVTPLAARK